MPRGVYARRPRSADQTEVIARFWAKVEKSDDCWLWTGLLNSGGYGRFWSGHQIPAHRFSWELHKGAVSEGIRVLHNCPGGDNRACVNPAHLWLGTQKDNLLDASRKYRLANQRKTHCSKGHPFVGDNVRPRYGRRGRACLTCRRANNGKAKRQRTAGRSYTVAAWKELVSHYERCPRCLRDWDAIPGRPGGGTVITVDHVVPVARGGLNSIDNVQPLCYSCNSQKGHRPEARSPSAGRKGQVEAATDLR